MMDETMDEVIERIRARQARDHADELEAQVQRMASLVGLTITDVTEGEDGYTLHLNDGRTISADYL
jgi:hypothetical protein